MYRRPLQEILDDLKAPSKVGQIAEKVIDQRIVSVTILHIVLSFNSIALISWEEKQMQILERKWNKKKEKSRKKKKIE